MDKLIARWQRDNYTEPLLCLILFITLVVSLANRKKYKTLKYLPIYITSFVLVYLSTISAFISKSAKYHSELFWGIANYMDYFFTLIELTIFSHFYCQLTNNNPIKRLVIFLNISFVIFFFFMLFKDKRFYQSISDATQSKVYTVEGAILLLICLFYFVQTFKKTSTLSLKNEPIFWVSAGLLFFLVCTLPYSILENYIDKNYVDLTNQLYSIFHIFYVALFLMIIRAYLCNPKRDT